jgi:hypothetical protein
MNGDGNNGNKRARSNSDIGQPREPRPRPSGPEPPAPADPMANRIGNTFGRVNMLAQHRRENGLADPSGFINNANQAIQALPATTRLETPYGPVTVSNGRDQAPRIATRREDYGDVVPPGRTFTEYRNWSNALGGDPATARHRALSMVHTLSGWHELPSSGPNVPPPLAPHDHLPAPGHLENRAMASLVTTISVAEEARVDGAGAMGLSAMRRIVTGQSTMASAFTGAHPEFPMAGDGGTDRTRQLALGTAQPTAEERRGLSEIQPPGSRPRRWSI